MDGCVLNICVYASKYVSMYLCIYESMYQCINVCMYVCVYVRMRVCVYVCVCMYVCMHACMYVRRIYACQCMAMYVNVCQCTSLYVNVCHRMSMHVNECQCKHGCMYAFMYVCVDQNSFVRERRFFPNKTCSSAKTSVKSIFSFAEPTCWPTMPLMKIHSSLAKLCETITDHFLIAW